MRGRDHQHGLHQLVRERVRPQRVQECVLAQDRPVGVADLEILVDEQVAHILPRQHVRALLPQLPVDAFVCVAAAFYHRCGHVQRLLASRQLLLHDPRQVPLLAEVRDRG